jgi:hypothetical protein
MALLIQNQAALVTQHTAFVAHLDEDRQRFSRIERDLDLIKALLVKHEGMPEKLVWSKKSCVITKFANPHRQGLTYALD